VSKTSVECTELMASNPEFNKVMKDIRGFRQANTLIEKIDALLDRVTDDDILPLEMMYCGARHTRRWSSRGFNIQNLHKVPLVLSGDMSPNDIIHATHNGDAIPEEVEYVYPRFWIVPPPGKTFLILDYAQIEPRCLNWLAGNDVLLQLIREGFSVYEAYARSIGAWSGNDSLKTGDPSLYASMKAEVLGLGYGMGAKHYGELNNMTEEEAKPIVSRFREKNPLITKMWRDFDGLLSNALMDRSHTLDIEMPNGEWLRHFRINQVMKKDPKTGRVRSSFQSFTVKGDSGKASLQTNLWGGGLTENVTQRMARDVMALALVNLSKAGFNIVFSAHDEAVLAVDDDETKEDARREAERILSVPPPWADDLPLQVEGDFSNRYTKL